MTGRWRRYPLLVGLGLGAAALAVPLASTTASPPALQMLLMLVLVGVGIPGVMLLRMKADHGRPHVPRPQHPKPPAVPGETFDDLLDDAELDRNGNPTYALRRAHDRLRAVAEETLAIEGQLTPGAARQRVETGSWGDDEVASRFLSGGPGEIPRLQGSIDRLRTGRTSAQVIVERTVAALVRATGRTPRSQPRRSVADWLEGMVRGRRRPAMDGRYTVVPADHTVRVSARWHGISALALVGIGAGVGFGSQPMFVLGAIGVGYAAYARTALLPQLDLSATRTLSDESPKPGDDVVVTVSVRNDARYPVPDVRLIDGVPEAIGVLEGAPQHATSIPPGEEISFSYTIRARRGCHEFGPVRVLARDLADVVEHDLTLPVETTFTCEPGRPLSEQLLRPDATQFLGRLPTSVGGEGVAFHSTRAYRRGDPLRRIDWNRLARTGELATVAFDEERATSVVLVVDGRDLAYAAPRSDARSAYERGLLAAVRSVSRLRRDGNAVGLAALSSTSCWVRPDSDAAVEARINDLLANHPAFAPLPPTDRCFTDDWVDEFRRRFPGPAQVLFFSPIRDPGAVNVARSMETYGYPVTVVSPDPSTLASVGTQLAALERRIRVHEVRREGIRVVDWADNEPLGVAALRAVRRWSG